MAGPSREGEILDGKYRIVRKLGEGGMGAVYAGEHVRLKKAVAIKMLHAGANVLAEMADRFEREAQAASQIGSDHIVEVFDIGITAGGDRFMVMEYLDGEPLRTRLRRLKRMRETEVAELGIQLLEGLRAAHQAGIVHRDLKPDNVFICREKAGRRDFVKVLDFGISKFAQAGDSGAMTKTGTIMGSPNYMSPEHVQASHEVDARSDLYSVGIVLWEAVTGKLPRKAATFAEILFKVVYEPVQDPRSVEADIDPDFAAIVMTACAHPKEARFQSAESFKAALEGFLRSRRASLDDVGSTTTVLAPTAGPAPVASSPGSTSQPQLSGSQPSFNTPGHGYHPGVPTPGAIPSQPAFGSSSQPSFGASSQPSFGASSQPSFGASSQPSFGASSQPSFGASSQPSFGASSQPSFGASSQAGAAPSQPAFGTGSQPSYASQFSVTHQGSAEPTKQKRRVGVVLALLGAAAAGVTVAAVLATQGGAPPPPPRAAASGVAAAAPSADTPAAADTMTAPSSSADRPEPVESSVASASASTTATAKPPLPTGRPPAGKPTGGKPPGDDKPGIKPGY